jgi:hypothetical protein
MSLKRSMLKTLAMLAMGSTMTADKNIYSNQRLSNEGMRFNPDYRRPSTSRELKEFTIKGQKICAYSRKDAIKRLKARGEL